MLLFTTRSCSSALLSVMVSFLSIATMHAHEAHYLAAAQEGPQVGQRGCVEGYVMDFFCINRGTLLDAPSVETLVNPELHSFHCLLDVPSCINTNYEILLDPKANETKFSRGWVLDGTSKTTVMEEGRRLGGSGCTTCTGEGSLARGFRVAMNVTVMDLGSDTMPPTIGEISDLIQLAPNATACTETTMLTNAARITGAGTNFRQLVFAHGSLMLISWGWLLPSGVVFAKLFRHRPDGLWFKIHKFLQPFALLCALIGWGIALANFTALQDVGSQTYNHAVMGMTVMIMGLLQPINAVLRPHAPEDGETIAAPRRAWEILHKVLGYGSILLAVPTIVLGTMFLPTVAIQRKFQICYGAGVGGFLFVLIIMLIWDSKSYKPVPAEGKVTEETKASKREEGAEEEA